MKIELSLTPGDWILVSIAVQPVYNTKSHTRREKSTLSIALDVSKKVDAKACSLKASQNLFNQAKKVKISFKHHEADMLELLLIDQIGSISDSYIKGRIQLVINQLNQKLV